jgi:hypothetical protein
MVGEGGKVEQVDEVDERDKVTIVSQILPTLYPELRFVLYVSASRCYAVTCVFVST